VSLVVREHGKGSRVSADVAVGIGGEIGHALTSVKRVAGQVKPDPKTVAIETTIRQVDRYCMWWTSQTASFPVPPATFRSPAAELSKAPA